MSLVSVQAGASQMTTADTEAREVARFVLRTSARALDELRQMVGVVRASGGTTDTLAPQPLPRDLPAPSPTANWTSTPAWTYRSPCRVRTPDTRPCCGPPTARCRKG
ncbi:MULTISPECIES: hypothetical protein [unclassified Streptomyces]|uniref:hypothetical protein n=1 Tax=unclassified Streptomyces TaxID=2593676 RepID=UPI00352F9F88